VGARRIVRITVLGPQRRPTLDAVARSLDVAGPVATVTAGWQEREPDDAELDGLLGGRGVNLGLHARWQDVLERDPEYTTAEREHRAGLAERQELHLVQLDGAVGALREVARRGGSREPVRGAARVDAEAVVRLVDERHLARVAEAREEFERVWRPGERDAVAGHRAAVREVLAGAGALVVAGGHVGVLLHVLRLFAVTAPPVVIAWSAGAMALTERVLLFHDRAPHGPAHPEFLDAGLGWLPGCVLLPHARRRLRTDDHPRMAELAARVAPAVCVVLDDGMRLNVADDGTLPPETRVVAGDGRVAEVRLRRPCVVAGAGAIVPVPEHRRCP
jgi:hypothetical protein